MVEVSGLMRGRMEKDNKAFGVQSCCGGVSVVSIPVCSDLSM